MHRNFSQAANHVDNFLVAYYLDTLVENTSSFFATQTVTRTEAILSSLVLDVKIYSKAHSFGTILAILIPVKE